MLLSSRQKIFVVAAVLVLGAIAVAGAFSFMYVEDPYALQVHNTGVVSAVGFNVWADSELATPLTSISWGAFSPGDVHTVTCWIQNSQNTNIVLSYTLGNWSPSSGSEYLVFSWNYTGETLVPGEVLPVQLSLQVLANITGITSFSFDITITATQA